MFNQLFKQPQTISHHLKAPLLDDRLRYLDHRAKQGATKTVLKEIAYYQLILIRYLHFKENKILKIEEIETAANRWASHEILPFSRPNVTNVTCKLRFIQHATLWLRFLGRIEIPPQPAVPIQITEFAEYMRTEKNLSEITIGNSCYFLKRFFNQIKENPCQFLVTLTPAYLDSFLILKLKQGTYSHRTIQFDVSTLRIFLRYAEHRGWCQLGIADSIQSPHTYKHQTLPSSPSWENVQRLLKGTEGNSPSNIRDRAVLLLLSVYGMRASEVRHLCFENIDWEKGIIYLKHSKLGPRQQLPLVPTVAQALINYIKKARPQCSIHREIFLTIYAPFRPLKTLFNIVGRRWEPLDVDINHHGPHSLRHACATRLINQGMSLKTIADQLGHRNLDTTRIYAKVDLIRLREVASFDMGGLS